MSVTIEGVDAVNAKLTALIKNLTKQAARGVNIEGERVMSLAKPQTPVDDGTLRNSGFVEPPEISGDVITLTLGFGGAAAPYAIIQHERLDFAHTVGGAKYLEKPLLEQAPTMAMRIVSQMKLKA